MTLLKKMMMVTMSILIISTPVFAMANSHLFAQDDTKKEYNSDSEDEGSTDNNSENEPAEPPAGESEQQ
jgi:hypothetical protein